MADFALPTIAENADGWGPALDNFPSRYSEIPYAPYAKSDRLGRAADWTSYSGRGGLRDAEADEDGKFTVVDNRNVPRSTRGSWRGRSRGRGRGRGRNTGGRYGGGGNVWGGRGGSRNRGRSTRRWDDRRNVPREASVVVGPEWSLCDEVTFSQMGKMGMGKNGVADGVDVVKCGKLWFYDKGWDRVNGKTPRVLRKIEGGGDRVTTTDDPVIRRLAGEDVGSVFVTSSILGLLMVAPRTSLPWDVIVQRIGGKLFFDKRDGSTIDQVTVNETAHDAPRDAKNLSGADLINSQQQLSDEATEINKSYAQIVLKRPKGEDDMVVFEEPNPFVEEGEEEVEVESVAYRYRKWVVNDKITLVARCEVDGAIAPTSKEEKPVLLSIKALNEVADSSLRAGTDWRNKLDTQRGAVLASELKNNAGKLARWTVEALLADTDQIKFGFVTRVNQRSNQNHIVLGTQMYRPKEFAAQIALNVGNMWAIFSNLVEMCYKHLEDGEKGVIMKDPNKTIVRLYKVPDTAFESDEEEEEESGDEEYSDN